MSIDDTRSAYNIFADREWHRLESGAQARLEYRVTSHVLECHLPEPAPGIRILDAGGGPGRYTIALAEHGYSVTLLDLSPKLLDIARHRIADRSMATQTRIDAIASERAPVYFCLPEEFRQDLEEAGLPVERMYGCQGNGAHLDETNLLALMVDEHRWPQWERELLATCDHPNVVGVSNHLLAVTRK